MDLKDFVARTLAEIAEGVSLGSKAAAEFGAIVSPQDASPGGVDRPYGKTVNVEFTIGLTVTDATATKGGIGVVAGIFALGSQGASNASTDSTTHVKFLVPVILPAPTAKPKR